MRQQFEGVDYDETQMAFRSRAGEGHVSSYEDYFADAESAALARDLAILQRGLSDSRNFPELGLRGICQRLLETLRERHQEGLPGAFEWLKRVGMNESEFFRIAEP